MTRPMTRPRGMFTYRADVRRARDDANKDHYGQDSRTLDPSKAPKIAVFPCAWWTQTVRTFAGDERGGANVEYGIMLSVGSDIRATDLIQITDRLGNVLTPWLEIDRIEPRPPSHLTAWAVVYGQ